MKWNNGRIKFIILFILSTSSFSALDNKYSKAFLPRISLWGSSGSTSFAESDVMFPLLSNSNQIFYLDAIAKYGENTSWVASLGLGLRRIVSSDTIIGGYIFTDYNRTANAHYFTIISPGIEWMTNNWDAHVNGYIPVGKNHSVTNTLTPNQLGLGNLNFYQGHAEYQPVFEKIESVGSGIDFEIGRTFHFTSAQRARIFAGGYYFDLKYSQNINGVEAGIELPLKYRWASLEIQDSYDNVNWNTLLLTFRLTFGGIDKTDQPIIQERMLDRIPRYVGSLNYGDGIPSEQSIVSRGRSAIIINNIWFFNPDGTPTTILGIQNCTFEHPCVGLAQNQIDTINILTPNANLYFGSGTYINPQQGLGYHIYNGQQLSGFTPDFSQLATGDNRPILNDSLILAGNNTVNNLQVFAHSEVNISTGGMFVPIQTGIFVSPTASGIANINNTRVVSINSTLNSAGIVNNSPTATVNINQSDFVSETLNVPGSVTIGAANVGSGTLNVINSSIAVSEADTVNNFNVVFGIINNENGTINIANSNIMANTINAGLTAGILNNSTTGSGFINISQSTVTVNAENSNLAADIFNQANNISGVGGIVNIDQSALNITTNNNSGGLTGGIINSADSTVNLARSTIVSNSDDGTVAAVINSDSVSKFSLQNNVLAINLTGTAIGAPVVDNGIILNNTGNQCFVDGVAVPCI